MNPYILSTLLATAALAQVQPVAHRGFKAVAPENTIAAFEAAATAGAAYMETDIRRTRDGVLILLHDATVDRTTTGTGPVADLTFAHLRRLNPSIPTFREALLWAKQKGVRIDVDHKAGPVEELAAVIRETGMTQRVVIEGPRDNLLQFAKLLPGVDTMPKVTSVEDTRAVCALLHTTVIRLSLDQLADPQYVKAVHECGARVSVTILGAQDNEDGIRRVIQQGAQLIETDHPDLVAKLGL